MNFWFRVEIVSKILCTDFSSVTAAAAFSRVAVASFTPLISRESTLARTLIVSTATAAFFGSFVRVTPFNLVIRSFAVFAYSSNWVLVNSQNLPYLFAPHLQTLNPEALVTQSPPLQELESEQIV